MLKSLLAASTALALASPALADAVTYRGAVGDIPVVVEFAIGPGSSPEGMPFARYFYASKGVDIPLLSLGSDGNIFFLEEKAPCTPDTCSDEESGVVAFTPPSGAWQLEISGDGEQLKGFWAGPEATETLPLTLERVGSRPFEVAPDGTPETLAQFAVDAVWAGEAITPETSPYDYLKMTSVELKVVEEAAMGANRYRTVADPRTVFAYPRLVELADGSDTGPANEFLEQRHWAMNASALSCLAMQYPGMGWNGFIAEMVGTLGGYEDELVTVNYLSPSVMSWTESGSLFCGGAHPYNHIDAYNLDVRSGERLDLSAIFSAWIAKDYEGNAVDLAAARANPAEYVWGGTDALIDYVIATREPEDADFEAECATNDLIREHLTISFAQDERVVFGLGGLPSVIQACGADVLVVPLADLPAEFLMPEAADYFPSLRD